MAKSFFKKASLCDFPVELCIFGIHYQRPQHINVTSVQSGASFVYILMRSKLIGCTDADVHCAVRLMLMKRCATRSELNNPLLYIIKHIVRSLYMLCQTLWSVGSWHEC
uniref:Uncharacterized protein n=1 Tax=Pararge aegeria TaxID=116150 RepID=S4NRQ9_9NEOP